MKEFYPSRCKFKAWKSFFFFFDLEKTEQKSFKGTWNNFAYVLRAGLLELHGVDAPCNFLIN